MGMLRQRDESHLGEGGRKQWLDAKWRPLWVAEEITGDVESRRAKLSDKQHTVKREKTGGKAEINSHKDIFSRGQEFWEEMI